MPSPSPAAGGFPIAMGAIGGALIGMIRQQATIGFFIGLTVGILIALLIWLRSR